MTAAVPGFTDPGATPTSARALAPDLARGGMLLLIALANVHLYLYGRPVGVRGYPADLQGVDQVVAAVQMTLVDGRAYPLFGLLFGYGIVQLTWRRVRAGWPAPAVVRLVRRRGLALIAIGLVHGLLLWSGDIVGAYGLVALLMAGLLVHGKDSSLLVTAGVGIGVVSLVFALAGIPLEGTQQPPLVVSVTLPDAGAAALARAAEWATNGLPGQALGVFGAVALGAWAARRGLLDEPERHRRLLVRVAVVGLAAAVLGGLPFALMAAQVWTAPSLGVAALAGSLHALGGYAGGAGYAALFGLLAIRLTRRGGGGPIAYALQAAGQRSLSCYLAQSVAFVALLPAWTLGLGAELRLWQAALVAIGVWAVTVLIAALSARSGRRGPAEALLRRLTYGARPGARSSAPPAG